MMGSFMTESTAAALHIQGSTLRYVEVGRDGEDDDLRRLGEESLPFDLGRVLWEEENDDLDHAAEVVERAFAGLEADSFRIVVHPMDVFSVFLPIPAGVSGKQRRRYATSQTALVTGARSPDTLALTLQSVRTAEGEEGPIEWVHVLALPKAVAGRMSVLTDGLPVQEVSRMVSTEAAAQVADGMEDPIASGEYGLAVGLYATHTEYVLIRNGDWYHAHAAQEARRPENRAYYAVGFLNRVGVAVEAVDALFVYGSEADPAGLSDAVFDCRSVLMTPFPQFSEGTDRVEAGDGAEAYVPCVGGALAVLQSE